jgi:hypothetical protein
MRSLEAVISRNIQVVSPDIRKFRSLEPVLAILAINGRTKSAQIVFGVLLVADPEAFTDRPLYQGTTSVVPQMAAKSSGLQPLR